MNKIVLFFFMCMAALSSMAQSNTGIVKGSIATSDGKPAAYVTVYVDGYKPVMTDEDGNFIISSVNPGSYKLIASLVNHEPVTQAIEVTAGKTTQVSLGLSLTNKELEAVTVTSPLKTFAQKETESVARMPLKNLENPQVYSVITGKVLKEQVAVDVKDAIRNSPGALPVFFPGGGI
jgi:iron complex outermembrane receptor protein